MVRTILALVISSLPWLPLASAQVVVGNQHDPLPHLSRSRDPLGVGAVLDLGCSPVPCVLPNAQVSADPTNSTVIAASPSHPAHLLAGAYDQSECFEAGAFASGNGGSSWNLTCVRLAASGDPALAYGRRLEYMVGTNGGSEGAAVYVQASANNGVTWSSGLQVVGPLLNGGLTNEPWIQVDNSDSSQYANAAYVSVTQFDFLVVESEISASHSADGGNTWTTTTVDPVQYKPEVGSVQPHGGRQ
jgi:hypothetical protein